MALPEKKHRNVVLNLGGTVTPAQFLRGVKDFFGILRSVAKNVTDDKGGVRWEISVKEGSNLIVATGLPKGISTKEDVMLTINSINTGIEALATGTTEHPKHFTEKALDLVKDLAALAEGAKNQGLDTIEFRVDGVAIPVGAEAAASVNRIRGKEHTAIGSIEGKVRTVSDRNGFRVVVYDSLRDRSVNCFFSDEELLDQALLAFRKRVTVFGTVRYRKDGTPISVRVDRIRVFRSQDELPPISQIQGIFKRAR